MDRHERDELANPPEVVDALATEPGNHNDNPLSTRIWQRLNDKVQRQCEDGIVNLILLGQPRPWNDNSVEDALHGAPFAAVGFIEDEAGVRHPLSASLQRTLSGPFRPYTDLPPDLPPDDRERLTQLRASFSRLSAVVLFRLGGTRPRATVYTNPNAGVKLPAADGQRLETTVLARAKRTRQAM
jgi:hypothetical protein